MNKFYILGSFVLGAVAGVVGSCYFFKNKYEKLAQEEISEVREHYRVKREKTQDIPEQEVEHDDVEEVDVKVVDSGIKDYKSILNKAGYVDYSNANLNDDDIEDNDTGFDYNLVDEDPDDQMEYMYFNPDGEIVVIPPEECGEDDTYDVVSLDYFADGYLVDETHRPVDNINGTVGADFYKHFGEYDGDVVYIRNDKYRCYYEITEDVRNYTDVIETLPPSLRRDL